MALQNHDINLLIAPATNRIQGLMMNRQKLMDLASSQIAAVTIDEIGRQDLQPHPSSRGKPPTRSSK